MANNTYDMVMSGKSDSNIRFTDFRNLILSYGFRERIKGDHYIYKRDGIIEKNCYTAFRQQSKSISSKTSANVI